MKQLNPIMVFLIRDITKVISLYLLLICKVSNGQDASKRDSTSILSYVDKIILKVNLDTQVDGYTITDTSDETELIVSPNDNSRLTLSLDYEFLGFSVGFAPKFFDENNDDDLKGKSSFTDYQFRFFLGSWTQGLQFRRTKGFFIENTLELLPDWVSGDPFIQLPNLEITRWSGSTSYVFNPRFSLRNVVYQTEWQRKSAGSFIPELTYSYNTVFNSGSDFEAEERYVDLKLDAAYFYTWVIHKNWFISPSISPSVGVRFSKYKESVADMSVIEKDQFMFQGFKGGLQLGYSSRKVIFGANLNFNSIWYSEDETATIDEDQAFGKIYLGYRLDAPKAIQKPFKWVNKQFGF